LIKSTGASYRETYVLHIVISRRLRLPEIGVERTARGQN